MLQGDPGGQNVNRASVVDPPPGGFGLAAALGGDSDVNKNEDEKTGVKFADQSRSAESKGTKGSSSSSSGSSSTTGIELNKFEPRSSASSGRSGSAASSPSSGPSTSLLPWETALYCNGKFAWLFFWLTLVLLLYKRQRFAYGYGSGSVELEIAILLTYPILQGTRYWFAHNAAVCADIADAGRKINFLCVFALLTLPVFLF